MGAGAPGMMCRRLMRQVAAALAVACASLGAAPGRALEDEVVVGVGVDSIGVFRGVRSRKLNPSPYVFVEGASGPFVVGAFASPVSIDDRAQSLVLAYASAEQAVHGFDLSVGGRYYAFTDPREFVFDFNDDGVAEHAGKKHLFEAGVSLARDFGGGRAKFSAYYTPDGFARTGPGLYAIGEVRADLFDGVQLRANGGVSRFRDDLYNDDYADIGIGLFKSAWGFDFYLKYSDTIALAGSDDRTLAFGIERAFTLFSSGGAQRRRMRKILNDWSIDKSQLGVSGLSRTTAD